MGWKCSGARPHVPRLKISHRLFAVKAGPSLVRERSVLRPCKVLDDWRRHVDPSKQEIARHQAYRLHRWTPDRRLCRRCVLEHFEGNRAGRRYNPVEDGYRYRQVAPRGKSVLRNPSVRTRPGPVTKTLGRSAAALMAFACRYKNKLWCRGNCRRSGA
jgi:hypothetical protein